MAVNSANLQNGLNAINDFGSLRELLHNELGWPRVQMDGLDAISYAELDADKQSQLKDAKLLFDFVPDQPWGICEVEFNKERLRISNLREILGGLKTHLRNLKNRHTWDELLFICKHGNKSFSFAHFAGDDPRKAKVSIFGWDDPQETHTLCRENLPKLQWPGNPNDSDAWKREWAAAWDVQKVTDAFFREYKRVFEIVKDQSITGIPDAEARKMFTQRLFNRLLFLCFVQKKGWLDNNSRYLFWLWERHTNPADHKKSFYQHILRPLFFGALNNNASQDVTWSREALNRLDIVPYLNGGLFTAQDGEPDNSDNVSVKNEAFADIFDFLGRFNFTVTESTPLDVEVAVDPEMLGKVFEELVTGRHETGSYYTPRPIVSFMCKEALKGYLETKLINRRDGQTTLNAIVRFVEEHDSAGFDEAGIDPECVLQALKDIKVCDPACGSGAFLLGMLQELVALRKALFKGKRETPYERKLEIIENNLYGVDIDPFATNLAMLRLWLSLMVESEEPRPLPNLEYKIETGDSLLGPDPSQPIDWSKSQRDLDFEGKEETVDALRKLREAYQKAHGPDKNQIKADLEAKLAELREKVTGKAEKDPARFDWRVEFFDVFLGDPKQRPPGFDAVLANPPYVRQERITAIKPALRSVFGDFYCGTADLYTYFYARAHQLLRPGGMLVFISSNKWFRAAYGANLRKLMADKTQVRSITDFGELPVFQSAATFPMIFVAQKGGFGVSPDSAHRPEAETTLHRRDGETTLRTIFTQVKSLDPPYPDVAALIAQSGFALPPNALNGAEWRLVDAETAARMRRMEQSGVPLGEYVKGKIYRGILTGFNQAFVIDGAKRAALIAEDPKSAEIIKPLAVGDDVRKWRIRKRDRWLIVTKIGVDMQRYPAIMRHLKQWEPQLRRRQDQGEQWWELRACAYYAEFDKPKIVYSEISMEPRFTLDRAGTHFSNTAYIMGSDEPFLLGLLNSASCWFFMTQTAAVVGDAEERGRVRMIRQYVEKIPIPRASGADRAAIEALVQQILDLKACDPDADVSEWEAEIDRRVEFLYFHADEAPTYEAWLASGKAFGDVGEEDE